MANDRKGEMLAPAAFRAKRLKLAKKRLGVPAKKGYSSEIGRTPRPTPNSGSISIKG